MPRVKTFSPSYRVKHAPSRSDAVFHLETNDDDIIVGGGTARSVVAARLAETPTMSVCHLEAGPTDDGNLEVLSLQNWFSRTWRAQPFLFSSNPPFSETLGFSHREEKIAPSREAVFVWELPNPHLSPRMVQG
jgi:choline dehydrogenase-like flavoprotein